MSMIRIAAGLVLCLMSAITAADAQSRYPSQSIRFVVPFTAGSATDTLSRLLGQHGSESLGQPVVVENIAGGSGVPAAQNVARAAPDGYTVLITSNTTHASNQSLLKSVWGQSHVNSPQYLRIFMRKLRQKIEVDPNRPKILLTELGVGYRLNDPRAAEHGRAE